jgi:hypothetical protein
MREKMYDKAGTSGAGRMGNSVSGGQIETKSSGLSPNEVMSKVSLKACDLAGVTWKTCLECEFAFCLKCANEERVYNKHRRVGK